MDAIDLVYHDEFLLDQKVTYTNFVCDYCPLKSDTYRLSMTMGVINWNIHIQLHHYQYRSLSQKLLQIVQCRIINYTTQKIVQLT